MRRTLHRLLLALAFPLCACASSDGAPPPADRPYTPAELREDFDALYAGLQAAHYDLYAHRDKAQYDAYFRRMRAAIDRPLDAWQAHLLFQRFAAYGRVAHARVNLPLDAWQAYREGDGKAFPLSLRLVGERAYVEDDRSGSDAVEEGDELLQVDGVPVSRWLAPIRALISADTLALSNAQIELRLPVLAWAAYGPAQSYRVVVRTADGRRRKASIAAGTRAQFEAAGAGRAPRFALDWDARIARVLDGGVAYLRPGPFYDNRPAADSPWDNAAFVAFVDAAFADFRARGAEHLILDLRDNPGGDNTFSDALLAWVADAPFRFSHRFEIRVSAQSTASNRSRLDAAGADAGGVSAQLDALYRDQPAGSTVAMPIDWVSPRADGGFEGTVHVLVNRHSYSNAVSVAAIVQDFGFGTVMGEETSDLASTYGAMERFALPNTGIEVGYPKARILRPSGDPSRRGVIPDIPIATPIMPGTEDAVLHRALEIVHGDRRGVD